MEKFFTFGKDTTNFNGLTFCVSNMKKPGKYEARAYKKYLYVKDGSCYMCTGTVLHIAEVMLPDGYYEVKRKNTKIITVLSVPNEKSEYPDFSHLTLFAPASDSENWKLSTTGDFDMLHTVVRQVILDIPTIRNRVTGILEDFTINFHYIENILKHDKDGIFDFYIHRTKPEPIIIQRTGQTAYVMTMKM